MRFTKIKSTLIKSGIAATLLLGGSALFAAPQQVNLAAAAIPGVTPDGATVPMWGYSCGAVVSGSTATCAPLNPTAAALGHWSPIVITIPTGSDLEISLANNLVFTPVGTGTTVNNVPTSLTIVGQLGGGLGAPQTAASPTHAPVPNTWFIAGDTTGSVFNPPGQAPRVQSFGTEVPAGGTANLCWGPSCATLVPALPATPALRPGTYLLESGTHPSIQGPMGLYGILVVTSAPASTTVPGTAYPKVSYAADLPLLFSEIDPMQNNAVSAAVNTNGFKETAARVLRDSVSSVGLTLDPNSGNVVNAGTGYVAGDAITFLPATACTTAPAAVVGTVDGTGAILTVNVTNPGQGCTQVPTVTAAATTGTGAQLTAALSLSTAMCSDGALACYPPAVNYTPLYYLINGAAFDKTNASASLFTANGGSAAAPVTTGITGNVLVRLVNAGLRMHVPSIVGSTIGASGAAGMALIAEDGNVLPGVPRVQSEVFMAAGKTYDVMINAPAAGAGSALPIYDRELSLSGNATGHDTGMLAYIGVNGNVVPAALTGASVAAVAHDDTFNALVASQTLTVSDPTKGVVANDVNVYGVTLLAQASSGTVTLNADGTFTYVPAGSGTSDTFSYCANGTVTAGVCSSGITANVTLGASSVVDSGITCTAPTFTSSIATRLISNSPGVLGTCTDGAGLALSVNNPTTSFPLVVAMTGGGTATVDATGGFTASVPAAGTYSFSVTPQNSQGTLGSPVNVTLNFLAGSGLAVTVVDGSDHTTPITDYRWIIEEDRTFFMDPACFTLDPTTHKLPPACMQTASGAAVNYGTNFHTSYMPVVAAGCTGPNSCESGQTLLGVPTVCDIGNGVCRTDAASETPVDPKSVHLDPNKRYYISILPGDAADPFAAGYTGAPDCSPAGVASGSCGHGMGGAPIAKGQLAVTLNTQPSPYPTASLSVFVFEDDFPLNGEHDSGGGVDVVAPNEQGLGGFEINLADDAGGTGDSTGQPTYDMFNQPLTNALAGRTDPVTNLDACPITPVITGDRTQQGTAGRVVTCPKYESDGQTLSPLAGQAVIANLYQGRYGVIATPAADRIARGEEWLQTNTLDGQKAHDSFMRIGEPGYFQEYGPAGFHVTIGFANPKIINDRRTNAGKTGLCDAAPNGGGLTCNNEVTGLVTTARMSRTPDQRLYGSGDRTGFGFTQCYASLGDPDGADFEFVKCDADGHFDFTGIPAGNYKITIFDQWNDQIVDGIMQAVGLKLNNVANPSCPGSTTAATKCDMGEIATHQWQANIYTRTYIDKNGNGIPDRDAATGNDLEGGLALAATNIRFRDGSFSNLNNTDLNGYAGFNEIFPLFNWYTIETDSTRYKTTGVHVVTDAGGPVDGSNPDGTACLGSTVNPCGASAIGASLANTYETYPLPTDLSLPGTVYCASGADCLTESASYMAGTPVASSLTTHSTGRIDPPNAFDSYGWQGFAGQSNFLEFGKKPFAPSENGGIHGHVIYASTRPFDDPQLLLQLTWEPMVPHVRINLYKEGFATDGITPTLTLVDYTDTTSFDDWAQGFNATSGLPNMNCPGQVGDGTVDPFLYGLQDQPQYLDVYNNGAAAAKALPYHSQYKCYDGLHNWNQLQPAPYDGQFRFPSVTGINPANGKPLGTNCTGCTTDPDATDPYRLGQPMLPAGKYVVEVVVPPGFELVKEEDKNILIGDNYIAPATVQIPGAGGSIFIIPDQASVGAAYNSYNAQNSTISLGRNSSLPSHEGDTGSDESFWPCVGEKRVVPDYLSLFPQAQEVSPFAGATRPLCDRKEVNLTDESSVLTKFYVFTSTHVAGHFTGIIMDDFTSEFDPFSPQFGEKFAPSYMPVSVKDWSGNEINRVYSDQFGLYNGLNYSTWEVDPPNPTGYGPTMMVMCMNDRGTGVTPDPQFQQGYSQFCYELAFMPGQTGYFDTPVVPTQAFSEGYNHTDCAYPDATPAVASVVNADSKMPQGPWVRPASNGTAATAAFTITSVARTTTTVNPTISSVTVNGTSITGATSIACGNSCSGNNNGNRQSALAGLVVTRINGLTGSNGGYTATQGTGNSSNVVTIKAPLGTSYNTDPVAVTLPNANVSVSPAATQLAGATAPTTASMVLTINALPDQQVENYGYTGPSMLAAPYNLPKVTRHFGFGTPAGTVALVGSDGISYPMTGVSWSDTAITGTVSTTVTNTSGTHTLPDCAVAQQSLYGGSPAKCGQLVITTAAGKTSIDTVTVTIGGKQPSVLAAGQSIQSAIDTASPGDMIIVPAGVYTEMVLMWKPVRLQGVGAASAIINADTQPAGKLLNPWRQRINCLFGLTQDGRPNYGSGADTSCSTGWTGASGGPNFPTIIIDRLPFEAILGWDATLNGNLAEQLIEPSLMGAYEGAGITVLGKGVNLQRNDTDPFGATVGAAFSTGTVLLTQNDCLVRNRATGVSSNPYPTNYYCNPSSIDGLGVRNASQGGGGILVHAYAHNLQLANNRVYNNLGTLGGGIMIGMGEHPDVNVGGAGAIQTTVPASCETSNITNLSLPFCFNMHVNVHHNSVTQNNSMGDELFSSTPAGAGGIAINTGADYYTAHHNWVCGNISSGDGAGMSHIGFIKNGRLENNLILFNQSTNPTITTNGGGLLVMGAPDHDPVCGANTDQDCVPDPTTVTPSDGSGPGTVVNANLLLGNSAESGSGGGLRLQEVNGSDVVAFPRGDQSGSNWNSVSVTNNLIVNNVAGWDGAGVSLQDSLKVDIVNNTIASNDSTASAGPLFSSLFAPLASAPGPTSGTICTVNNGTGSCPQPAGVVSVTNGAILQANLPTTANGFRCPSGYGSAGTGASCRYYSDPQLYNNVIWQNRSFVIGVGSLGSGLANQQKLVSLFNAFTNTAAASQTATGSCVAGSQYWEVGVRGDANPTTHVSVQNYNNANFTTLALAPAYTVLTDAADYAGAHNTGGLPHFTSQYCNGSRVPPENTQYANGFGWVVNPGTNETNGTPHPVFSLSPSATVDEGNNWVNLRFGPLSLTNPTLTGADGNYGGGAPLGNYAPLAGSSVINLIPSSANTAYNLAPNTDYNGAPRKTNGAVDAGAIEFTPPPFAVLQASPSTLSFGNAYIGSAPTQQVTVTNNGGVALAGNVTATGLTGVFASAVAGCNNLAAGASCTVTVTYTPTAAVLSNGTLTLTAAVAVAGSPVAVSGTGVTPPARPTLTLLDNFNRAAANTLGANWTEFTLGGTGALRVLDTTGGNTSTGVANANSAGSGYWSAASFGSRQYAAFTFGNTPQTGASVTLKGTGGPILGTRLDFIRVNWSAAGTITVTTTTTGGLTNASSQAIANAGATFVTGDVLTAAVDAGGVVYVWKNTTFLGTVTLPANGTLWTTGGGNIGINLPGGQRVDNFDGGNY